MEALEATGLDTLAVGGGVAANAQLRAALEKACEKKGAKLYIAPLSLCGDNAAMIGCQGYYEYLAGVRADLSLNAYATMDVDALRF